MTLSKERRVEIAKLGAHCRNNPRTPAERKAAKRQMVLKAMEARKVVRAQQRAASVTADGKVCVCCKETLPLTKFWADAKSFGGRRHTCSTCIVNKRSATRRARVYVPQPAAPAASLTFAQLTYREAKAAKQERDAVKLAEAKAAYDAMLAAQRETTKGGRPKRVQTTTVKRDPADALFEALQGRA